jgi:hypothetical protein
MKIRLLFTIIALLSIGMSNISKAQSIYKHKLENVQDTNSSAIGKTNYSSYNGYKFDKKNSLKANLISPFFNILTVFYTKYLDKETALQFGASIMTDFNYTSQDRVLNGQALTIEYRYLLKGSHANGTYIQPFTRFINASATAKYSNNNTNQSVTDKGSYNESCLSAGLGFLLGVQNTVKNKLVFDIYAGPVYAIQINPSSNRPSNASENTNRGGLQDLIVKGYGIRAGISMGFLF